MAKMTHVDGYVKDVWMGDYWIAFTTDRSAYQRKVSDPALVDGLRHVGVWLNDPIEYDNVLRGVSTGYRRLPYTTLLGLVHPVLRWPE